ncbi:TetR/AcrR family transcriptional regulator [Parvularcula sp. ZS-1/3]|uniref:TetR/AcrR family transcriptional regulator n=1 Tax=Parvularcula mediterranea TaxID=2732508 RepID=A0A7Y3RNU7_9PROT|nr:TetR/AcrR family transcriptional regulator [Parvularcula mediterranea]NNU17518.1 TetR/AcrR family transcriptional regulator [Parvularcula mediterranea]
MPSAAKNKANGYHHGDLRAALIDAAMVIVEKDGASALSLRGVAKAIEVSPAAPYHHFKDKQKLMAAIVEAGLKKFNQALETAANEADCPHKQLRDLGAAYVVFAAENPKLFELIQTPDFAGSTAPEGLVAERSKNFNILFETIRVCMPSASERQLRTACAAAWGLVHGIAVLAIDQRLNAVLPHEDLGRTTTELIEQINFAKAIGSGFQ